MPTQNSGKDASFSTAACILVAGLSLLAISGCLPALPDPGLADAPWDFAVATEELRARIASGQAFSPNAVAGACGNEGPLFTYQWVGPFAWQYDFFSRADGRFLTRTVDYSDTPFLAGGNYWPFPVNCSNPIITEVLGGTRYTVGDGQGVLMPPLGW